MKKPGNHSSGPSHSTPDRAHSTPDRDRHFATDHLSKGLRVRSIKGGRVSLVAQFTKFFISIGATAVLARILTPEEFGLVAMVMAFTTIASSFRDMGLTTATVQTSNVNHDQVSTLFWINLAFGALLCGVVSAASPGIAWFYGDSRAILVAIVLSTSFVLAGFGAQHQAILRRQMKFSILAAINVSAAVISALVAIAAALKGASYWSLVAMHTTLAAATSLGCWIACRWRPGLPSRATGLRSLLSFGGHLAGVSLILSLTRTADKALLGFAHGAGQVGLYNRAFNLLVIPVSHVAEPITGVAIAAMSRLQHDHDAYRSFYRKGILVFSSLTIPFVAFASVSAKPLVYTLLGDQWTDSIPLIPFLVPAALVISIRPATYWVYASIGHSRRQFLWSIACAPVIVLSLTIGMHWGAVGVAIAFSSALCLTGLPELPYCFRTTPVGLSDFAHALWRPVASSLVSGSLVFSLVLPLTDDWPSWLCLLLNLVVFGLFYVLSWVLLPGGLSTVRDVIDLRKQPPP